MIGEPAISRTAATFDANRARGVIEVGVAADGGRTRLARLREEGALRLRFPNAPPGALEAVVINTAGGAAGGDRFRFAIDAGEDAALAVTTAAAEKVYRSLGSDTEMAVAISAAPGARVTWLPQETILFDRARLSRAIDIDVAEGGTLVLAEAVVFGRAAHDERVEEGRLIDRWRVRVGGRLAFAETLRLDGAIAQKLGEAAIGGGAAAIATVMIAPGGNAEAEAFRAVAEAFAGEAGISSWNGIAVARFCAPDGATLRADMVTALAALGVAMPRIWFN